MADIDANYTFCLKAFFKDEEEPVLVKIRKDESERFRRNIESFNEGKSLTHYFVCDTIDGKHVGINLAHIQAVNILWNPMPFPEEQSDYKGPIKIKLKGRREAIETSTEDSDELFDFYTDLEHGPDVVGSLIGFTDEDGETLLVNINELTLLSKIT